MTTRRDLKVKREKISRGHYRLIREDGKAIEVRRGGFGNYWYEVNNRHRTEQRLKMFELMLQWNYY